MYKTNNAHKAPYLICMTTNMLSQNEAEDLIIRGGSKAYKGMGEWLKKQNVQKNRQTRRSQDYTHKRKRETNNDKKQKLVCVHACVRVYQCVILCDCGGCSYSILIYKVSATTTTSVMFGSQDEEHNQQHHALG